MERLAATLHNSQIFIQSILPTTPLWANCPGEEIILINQEIYKYCIKFNFTWIDLYTEFITDEGYLKDIYTDDGLHLNDAGYDLLANILRKYGLS